jgi:hypothetical protein
MPVRQTADPFTWQSLAPHSSWTWATYVAVLCVLFVAGGYFLGRTLPAPGAKHLDRTAIETARHTAVTAAHVSARENTFSSSGRDLSTQPSASPDRLPVVLLNPNTVERPSEVGGASAGPVAAPEEPDDHGEGRTAKPAPTKKARPRGSSGRLMRTQAPTGSYVNRPRVAVPRPSFANDDRRYKPRRYRDDRDRRRFTLRGVAMKLNSNAP